MSEGQGASMSLPIYGLYMQKVYADSSLPYSEDEVFDIPEDFAPCRSKFQTVEIAPSDTLSVSDEALPSLDIQEETQQEGFDDIFE